MNSAYPVVIQISLVAEAAVSLYFLTQYFSLRKIKHIQIYVFLYFLLYCSLLHVQDAYLSSMVLDPYYLFLGINLVMMFLYCFLFLRGGIMFKIFLPIVLLSLLTMVGFPATILGCNLLSQVISVVPVYASIGRAMQEVFYLLSALFILKHKMDVDHAYPVSYYWAMVVAPIANMINITLMKGTIGTYNFINYTGVLTLLTELLIYYTIWQSCTEYERRMLLQMEQQQQEYQDQHMAELKTIVTEYHQLRHDMKNHFACMDRFLSQGKYDELKNYFYSLSNELYALDNRIETGNEIVNQIINLKYAAAHQKNIPMNIKIIIPHELDLPDHVLCSILSNMLDNAIEASEKIQDPSIDVDMKIIKSYLSITIKNRIEDWQKANALSHKTTKSDPALHGLGHNIIIRTVEKYNGMSSFDVEGHHYVSNVMLLLNNV